MIKENVTDGGGSIGGVIMLAVKGSIQENALVLENEDIRKFNGKDVIVTILDSSSQIPKQIDFNQFVMPTERGGKADEYVRGLRENDRL
jgi:hypothetical protein